MLFGVGGGRGRDEARGGLVLVGSQVINEMHQLLQVEIPDEHLRRQVTGQASVQVQAAISSMKSQAEPTRTPAPR